MSKLFQALLTGMFISFILDFFIFLGIKQNYIDLYEIDLYYNILFADHQNIYLFSSASIFLGLIVTYLNKIKVSITIISFLSILALSTLIPSVGEELGKTLLMSKNITLKGDKHIYYGDIYYNGRKKITFYDNELQKIIRLNRTEVILDKKDLIK